MEAMRQALVEKLKEEHEVDMAKVIEDTGPKCLRWSSRHLQLRKMEEKLLKSQRYVEAASIKAEADEIKARESTSPSRRQRGACDQRHGKGEAMGHQGHGADIRSRDGRVGAGAVKAAKNCPLPSGWTFFAGPMACTEGASGLVL